MKVEFFKHNITQEEIDSVAQAMRSTFLTAGPVTKRFEEEFAKKLGVNHALGMTSWTTAAFLVLKAWDIKEGDEVIVPSMTFIATANVVVQTGAKVVFCDSEGSTGNLDASKIESLITPRTKAIIPVHLYGHMCDMKAIKALANKYNLKVLEDCAHCIEGTRDGRGPGQNSDAAVFSFYATKNMTCGEGGAVATNDVNLIERLRLLRLHGMSKSAADRYHGNYQHWDMELLGYKANMNDIQASMLMPQLNKIDEFRARREEICRYYESRFDAAGIRFPVVAPGTTSARHLFTIWVDPKRRDLMLDRLQKAGIGVAVNYRAVHQLSFYKKYLEGQTVNLPIAEQIGNSTITLPLYVKLTQEELSYVVDQVIKAFHG